MLEIKINLGTKIFFNNIYKTHLITLKKKLKSDKNVQKTGFFLHPQHKMWMELMALPPIVYYPSIRKETIDVPTYQRLLDSGSRPKLWSAYMERCENVSSAEARRQR